MSDLYKESDYVDVVDEVTGEPHPHKIPKAWLGTEYAQGLKKASKSGSGSSASSDPVDIPAGDPVEDWTNAQIDAYAKREVIDLGGASNKADRLAAIAAAKAAATTTVTGT
jgi:hypothetical protein